MQNRNVISIHVYTYHSIWPPVKLVLWLSLWLTKLLKETNVIICWKLASLCLCCYQLMGLWSQLFQLHQSTKRNVLFLSTLFFTNSAWSNKPADKTFLVMQSNKNTTLGGDHLVSGGVRIVPPITRFFCIFSVFLVVFVLYLWSSLCCLCGHILGSLSGHLCFHWCYCRHHHYHHYH